MRIHHLNCTTIHTNLRYRGVTHCLLLEGDSSLTLVDTGLGTRDYTSPSRHVRLFTRVNGIPCELNETGIRQVAKLGFKPEDVRDIVLTHLHLDHAGGVADFPWADVHVFRTEYEAATRPRRLSWVDRLGYAREHLGSGTNWVLHSLEGEKWCGFDCARVLGESPFYVLLVPLEGHSRGHCGVAVDSGEAWLFHAGDAYVRDMQIEPDDPRNPFPVWVRPLAQQLFPEEPLERLRLLQREHGGEITIFSSHDPIAYSRLRGVSIEEAVGLSSGPKGSPA